jgi:hypothetical protein
MQSITRHTTLAATMAGVILAGSTILAPAASQAGYAQMPIALGSGNWKIDVAKSHFGPERNTMVIERASSGGDAKDASNTFIVIANGKVYVATAPEASDANGVRKVDYGHWRNMKLVQVGENAKSADLCGFQCQSGLVENRLTLSFKGVNGGMPEIGNFVVFNQE